MSDLPSNLADCPFPPMRKAANLDVTDGVIRSIMTRSDFIVIGSGPAGRRAAIQAAKLGRDVLVVEKGRRVGGVSVHTGTIPSKTLRETVLNLTGWRERGVYGRGYRAKQNISAEDLRKRLHITLN